MKKKVPLCGPSKRSQASTKAAKNHPWKHEPSCPTPRALRIFKRNKRTPHPSETS